MWTYEHTETTRATPAQLWARGAEPATWPEWDPETATGSRITQGVTISGPLAPLIARVVGTGIAAGRPSAMRALARLAEGVPAQSGAPGTGRPR